MKKYIYEANRRQLNRPTEPLHIFCPAARTAVYAETEEEALALAKQKLRKQYLGSGILLGEVRLVKSVDLAIDWNYGYGEGRGTGSAEDKAALYADNK